MSEVREIRRQLCTLLTKLKPMPREADPVWHGDPEQLGQFISRRLNIETATGQPIDQAYVDRLASYMRKPKNSRTGPST